MRKRDSNKPNEHHGESTVESPINNLIWRNKDHKGSFGNIMKSGSRKGVI